MVSIFRSKCSTRREGRFSPGPGQALETLTVSRPLSPSALDPLRMGLPDLGHGIGLRAPHYEDVSNGIAAVDFVEIISENFMIAGGRPLDYLERVRARYPVVQHGVGLGIGGPAEPDREYLARLKALVRRTETPWLSDHFCWSGAAGAHLHELLPLPFTSEMIDRVAQRARMVQDFLEVRFALENTSSYLTYSSSQMPEWAFIAEIAERADIGLLLDVNNVYVSSVNHGLDAGEYLENLPHERILQIHVAGHTTVRGTLIDTHSRPVIDPVWALYRRALELTGPVSTSVEWDDDIPELKDVVLEAERARTIARAVSEEHRACAT
jgi:uncharacterized protein